MLRVWSTVGNSWGSGMVTFPVAAHSLPRDMTARKPLQRMLRVSFPPTWPITVVNTFPSPKGIHQTIGSCAPVPPRSGAE